MQVLFLSNKERSTVPNCWVKVAAWDRCDGSMKLLGGIGYLLRLIRLDDAKTACPVAMQLMQPISWINNLSDHHDLVTSCACGARSENSTWGKLDQRCLAS